MASTPQTRSESSPVTTLDLSAAVAELASAYRAPGESLAEFNTYEAARDYAGQLGAKSHIVTVGHELAWGVCKLTDAELSLKPIPVVETLRINASAPTFNPLGVVIDATITYGDFERGLNAAGWEAYATCDGKTHIRTKAEGERVRAAHRAERDREFWARTATPNGPIEVRAALCCGSDIDDEPPCLDCPERG